jgi:3-oxoacyl-[acyl-carrier-protein] synthase III
MAAKNRYAHIIGWGMYVPNNVVTNDDLAAILDTDDLWIRTRTGIRERRIAGEGQTTSQLALKAAQQALQITDVLPSEIDLIVVATSTPEHMFPSTASLVQHWLGASNAGAFDLSAACSGFVYGLDMVTQAIRAGSITTAVVIGAETMSRVLDWKDRSTSILFGDGAGAVVLQAHESEGGVLSSVLRSDGSGAELLTLPTQVSESIRSLNGVHDARLHKMYMSGGEVFKFATRVIGESIREAVDKAGITVDDLSAIIPHQANERIIQAAARSLHIDPSRFITNLSTYGNTSAASIPIALCDALRDGRIKEGDYVAMVGFGGGLTWAATVLKWGVADADERKLWHLKERQRRAGYLLVRIRARLRRINRRIELLLTQIFGSSQRFDN